MSRIGLASLGLLCLCLGACREDEKPGPLTGRIISVPFDASFPEAATMAEPGDTIRVGAAVTLTAPVTINSDQTPIVIVGDKVASITGPEHGASSLIFKAPKEGTSILGLTFFAPGGAGQGIAVDLEGGNTVTIEDCRFEDFAIQVIANGLTLTLTHNLMINPALFSVDGGGTATIQASRNTLFGAGDCGIRLRDTATLLAHNNIIADYVRFGIACTGNSKIANASGCNNLFDSDDSGVPYMLCTAPELDFSEDPLFCNPAALDFTLRQDSPCLDRMNCGLVGAFGFGCFPGLDF